MFRPSNVSQIFNDTIREPTLVPLDSFPVRAIAKGVQPGLLSVSPLQKVSDDARYGNRFQSSTIPSQVEKIGARPRPLLCSPPPPPP